MTLQDLQTRVAKTIKHDTGATVEVTFIGVNKLSVFAESKLDLDVAMGIMGQVGGVTLDSVECYEEDGEFVAFYNY